MVRVSVIIPTYNRAAQLAGAIRSVCEQRADGVEIVVVDDGSLDDTAAVVQASAKPVRYLRVPHSGRPAVARNAGLQVARGEFVAFLDSDDLFLPGKLAVQQAGLAAAPQAAVVYSDGTFFRDDPQRPIGRVLAGMPTPSGDAFPDLVRGNFLFPAVALVRRACLDAVGHFDERRVTAEDYDLWLRLAAVFPIVYVPAVVAAVRRARDSLSADAARVRAEALAVLRGIEARHPERMRGAGSARHEGYARTHGAIAVASLCAGGPLAAAYHAGCALGWAVRRPPTGASALWRWYRRRALRAAAAP